jgi:hypothetical protein
VKSLSIDDCSWFLSIDNYTLAWTKVLILIFVC